MLTTVASLLESGNEWQCKSCIHPSYVSADDVLVNVVGLSVGPATLCMPCKACDVLVSSILQLNLHAVGLNIWLDYP